MAGNVSRQYLKAMGIDSWLSRSESSAVPVVTEALSATESSAELSRPATDEATQLTPRKPVADVPAGPATSNQPPADQGHAVQAPQEQALQGQALQKIAQWPANSFADLLSRSRVVLADQILTAADADRPMLLVLERELTSPAEDLLAAMLKAIKVDPLAQSAATITRATEGEPLVDVCKRLQPSLVLVMAMVSDTSALTELDSQREELHSVSWLDVPVAITLHPQVLIENPQGKRPAWEDLKRVKAFLDGE